MIVFIKKNRTPIIILSTVVVALWCLLPAITIGNHHPFNSSFTKFIITIIVIMIPFLKEIIDSIKRLKRHNRAEIKAKITMVYTHIKLFLRQVPSKVKHAAVIVQNRQRIFIEYKQFRRNPAYLIIGHSASGSKSLLRGSHIHFIPTNALNNQMKELQLESKQFEWHFSDHSSFIIENNSNHKNIDHYRKLTRIIRKNRRLKPLNGVILSFDINQLLLLDHEQRKKQVGAFATRLKHLNATLNTIIPLYITFTMCDKISGFVNFYNDLSQEELTQIWGITFNYQNKINIKQTLEEFNHEYNILISRLEKRVLFTLDSEKSIEARERIQNFLNK